MNKKWKVMICAGGFLLFFGLGTGIAQVPIPEAQENLFSVWAKLSLIGYSQSEIETALSSVDSKKLARVKQRIRLNVIKNLSRVNLEEDIRMSTTEQELRIIREKIRIEVRFAGLENDRHLHVLIRHRFGIRMQRI